MVRSNHSSDFRFIDPLIPNLKRVVPTIDDLMRQPMFPPQPSRIPDEWRLLSPPAPSKGLSPFGPVPIVPPPPPPPHDVDPPSRPPQWLFGPPELAAGPAQTAARGLPALLAEVGGIDSSRSHSLPSGGLAALIQEYLRKN